MFSNHNVDKDIIPNSKFLNNLEKPKYLEHINIMSKLCKIKSISDFFLYFWDKSLKLNRFLTGPSLILLDNGEIYRKNLKKAKLDITEFLMQCRTSGYFNLSDIQTAILEPNGKISFLPKAEKRPMNPSDMNISVPVDKVVVNVVLDGIVLKENLYHTGNDELWLEKQLVSQGIQNVNDIYLATCDCNNNLSIYLKKDLENKHDFFD